jgi:hypothetical protein
MSGCGCVYVGEYEQATFFANPIRMARKQHKCGECRQVIMPGEQYESASGKWKDKIERHDTCLDCLSLREAFFCDGYLYESMWADWREALCDSGGTVDWLAIEKLTPRAKVKALETIQVIWDDMGDDD